MKEEIKVVARTKTGEMLKGYIQQKDLRQFKKADSIYLRLAASGNTVGTMISPEQLSGLFQVKTFDGRKPVLFKRIYFDLVRGIKRHVAVVLASTLMVFLSLAGLITLF